MQFRGKASHACSTPARTRSVPLRVASTILIYGRVAPRMANKVLLLERCGRISDLPIAGMLARTCFPAPPSKGTWCSGITPAQHAGGPGFNPQCVHSGVGATSNSNLHRGGRTLHQPGAIPRSRAWAARKMPSHYWHSRRHWVQVMTPPPPGVTRSMVAHAAAAFLLRIRALADLSESQSTPHPPRGRRWCRKRVAPWAAF